MCGLLYAIRTMFLLYSVTWLSQVYCNNYHPDRDFQLCNEDHETVGNVATASLLFTFFGMFSVLLCGQAKDYLTKKDRKADRGYILFANSVLLFITIAFMIWGNTELPYWFAVFLVGMIGFGDFGPYKTMSGAFAIDIGGKARKGDVSAWMGVASNGCGALILIVNGFLPNWAIMFWILLVLSVACAVCSLLIVRYDVQKFGTPTSARETPYIALEA
jgi:sugar phosphate permease